MSGKPSFFSQEKDQYISPNNIKKMEQLIAGIIKKSHCLQSTSLSVEKEEIKKLLQQIIDKANDISDAIRDKKETKTLQELCCELKKMPENLPDDMSVPHPLSLFFTFIAYVALFIMLIAASYLLGDIVQTLVSGSINELQPLLMNACFYIIPSSLIFLYSFSIAELMDQNGVSVQTLKSDIDTLNRLANNDDSFEQENTQTHLIDWSSVGIVG